MSGEGLGRDGGDAREGAARASIGLLRRRIDGLGEVVAGALSGRFEAAAGALSGDVIVTGVGASLGTARLFAWLCADRLRIGARFAPISAFAGEVPPAGRTLVVVSQGLSPNARLALRHAGRYERTIVLTSARPSSDGAGELLAQIAGRGGVIVRHPPEEEGGMLLRVLGPAAAAAAACAIVETARGAGELLAEIAGKISDAIATAPARAEEAAAGVTSEMLDGPCAFVSVGVDPGVLVGHRWKWLEGLRRCEPCGWDLLEIAHGPIQSAARPMPFFVLASAGDGGDALRGRLGEVLSPGGHPRVTLRSALGFPFSIADHDAQLDALLLRVLDERPRDLAVSACAGDDEPLYGMGR
ncbi:MAG: hypothetical protein R3B70_00835 [Polyangiaceae bacterium]